MFKFKIDKGIITEAIRQTDNFNFGKRGKFDGTKKQQTFGIIAEQMIRDLFDAGKIDGSIGYDGGYDIKIKDKLIDVKTMIRNCDPMDGFVSNFNGLQIKHLANYFIFTSINQKKRTLTVCGWITKKDFLEKADLFKEGEYRFRRDKTKFKTKSDLYEINNNKLNNVNTPEQLIKQIKND